MAQRSPSSVADMGRAHSNWGARRDLALDDGDLNGAYFTQPACVSEESGGCESYHGRGLRLLVDHTRHTGAAFS